MTLRLFWKCVALYVSQVISVVVRWLIHKCWCVLKMCSLLYTLFKYCAWYVLCFWQLLQCFHSGAVSCGETSDLLMCALSFRCCRLWWNVWFTACALSFRCCWLWWDVIFTSVCSFIQVLSVLVRRLIHQRVLFHSGAGGCGETSHSPACAVQPGSHQSLQVPHPQGQGSLQTEPSRVFTCESVTCTVPFLFLSCYDCSVWHPLALMGPVLFNNRLGVVSDSTFLGGSLPFGHCVLGIFCHEEHC